METIRLHDLTAGTLCRIGITLSSYFWLPASVLWGIVVASGILPAMGLGESHSRVIGFMSGFGQGIASSIVTDAAILLGVLSYALARRSWGAVNFTLELRQRLQNP